MHRILPYQLAACSGWATFLRKESRPFAVSLATTSVNLNHIAPKQVIETIREQEWTP